VTSPTTEAERVLAGIPKRASDLARGELIDLVDKLQVWLCGDGDGKVWKSDEEVNGADFLEAVSLIFGRHGLLIGSEFDGDEIRRVE
jgi:hypothetical protein